jgi:hypothetical protein
MSEARLQEEVEMIRGKSRRVVTVLAAFLLLVGVSSAATASSTGVPIEERLSGYTTSITYADPGDVLATSDVEGRCETPSNWVSTSRGTGTISHLGRVSWVTEHCFQLSSATFGEADLVIVAANGDMLFGTYDGAMTGATTFVEEMVITGGTGRFVGASGVVAESGWFDPATGYMEVTGGGVIFYDGSERSNR